MSAHTATATRLVAGQKYAAIVTGKRAGERVNTPIAFTASRDQEAEAFIRDRETTPDQDRVFVVDPYGHGSVPRLVVTGSIKPMPALGDRVLVAVHIMGEDFDVEAEVVQIDGPRIIAKPEGALVTAFARTEWIAL